MQAQGMWSAGEGDNNERFLADLRSLRDTAALEFDELAARAHYPSDVLKEAAYGPSLPSLPILAAYVRACDGDVPEWEERWRRLGFESRADPRLPVRPAGASPAAVAGARASVGVAPPDAYDPERIRAALRGSHGRSDRGAGGARRQVAARSIDPEIPAAAELRVPESPASWAGGASWDETTRWDAERNAETVTGWDAGARWEGAAADLTSTPTNGNHHASQPGGGSSDAAVIETPDEARADAIRRDPFSADWRQDRQLASPPTAESGRSAEIADEPSAAAPDSWFTPRETPDGERTRDAEPSPGAADTWFAPRPGPPPAERHAIPRASWPGPTETQASDTPTAADRTVPIRAQTAAVAPPRTLSGPAVPPGPVLPPSKSRADRLYPVRLLVVILVAALIGSILVLLLR